jgi:hypothetical protein
MVLIINMIAITVLGASLINCKRDEPQINNVNSYRVIIANRTQFSVVLRSYNSGNSSPVFLDSITGKKAKSYTTFSYLFMPTTFPVVGDSLKISFSDGRSLIIEEMDSLPDARSTALKWRHSPLNKNAYNFAIINEREYAGFFEIVDSLYILAK